MRQTELRAVVRHFARKPLLLWRALKLLAASRDPSAVLSRAREYISIKAAQEDVESRSEALANRLFDWRQADRSGMGRRLEALGGRPRLSIVTPVYNTPERLLRACIDSVNDQIYPDWELILVDDSSPDPSARLLAAGYAEADPRIRLLARERNGGISAASNDGVMASSGDYLLFLDHDDEISPDALLRFAEEIDRHPETDAIYSDQWKCDEDGEIIDHHLKPDWSPTLLNGVMYIGHLLCVRASLVRALGGFDGRFDGVQDFEFMLRVSERTDRIRHIPQPLYKWRAIRGSVASGADEKSGLGEKQVEAVNAHLERIGSRMRAEPHPSLPHRAVLRAHDRASRGKVSIIIPSRDQGPIVARCLDSIYRLTDYPDFEVVLVDNGTTDAVALEAFGRHPIKRVIFDQAFNYSRANNLGVSAADGEFVMLLNNDTEVLEPGWLTDLVAYLDDPKVGAVGPVLLYPDGRVQHAGVVLGCRGTADHVMRFFPEGVDGYAGSLACSREVTAVTAACLLMRTSLYTGLGGLCEDYAAHYQDVDLCLKIRQKGYSIICASYPRLIHHESASRGSSRYDFIDRAILVDRWLDEIRSPDPYYNIWLNIDRLDYSLAKP